MNSINKFGLDFQEKFIENFTFFGFNHSISLWLIIFSTLALILFISYGTFFIITHYFLESIKKYIAKKYPTLSANFFSYRVLNHLSHLIPACIIYTCADLLTIAPTIYSINIANTLKSLAVVYAMVSVSFALCALLDLYEQHYKNSRDNNRHSIRGYIQGIKIIILVVTFILAFSELLNKSPIYLLTSIGAITAIILMVFKDQLLGFAANIQIATTDLVRVGDWIEVPQYEVDGNVLEISINRITVQNFDNTTASIPTYALLSNGVKNWRGVKEAGGRRIKRAFYIDANTIRFCDDFLLQSLSKSKLMTTKLYQKFLEENELRASINMPLTNLSLFRFYLQNYINSHPRIHDKMTRIVRHLDPTSTGIPIEVYMFTRETNWPYYEAIQADIFDHIFAVLPYFKLAVFQHPSGTSVNFSAVTFEPLKIQGVKEKITS